MQKSLCDVKKRLQYEFQDKQLLETALTHSSYANETGAVHYERLEFLGDSILNYCISEYIFRNEQHLSEGELTKKRARLVCENTAYQCARDLDLFSDIRVGNSFKHKTKVNKSIAADVIEALIAAVYLDSDLETVRCFVLRLFRDYLNQPETLIQTKDYKTMLQEYCQKEFAHTPTYNTVKTSGPDHQRMFEVQVSYQNHFSENGKGRTKKEAAQEAAKQVLMKLNAR